MHLFREVVLLLALLLNWITMKKKKFINELLYIPEIPSCKGTPVLVDFGFTYLEREEGVEEYEELSTVKNFLLFLMEGRFFMSCNHYLDREFGAGDLILIPKSSMVKIRREGRSRVVCLAFDVPHSSCDKEAFQLLAHLSEREEHGFEGVKIRHPLNHFLELLIACLTNRVNCTHFHEVMERELFMVLRGFYSKAELVRLFYPLLGKEVNFKDFVLENYVKVNSVEELINLSTMGRSSFYAKFKEVFGESAKKWMIRQMNRRIVAKASELGATVIDLMDVSGIDSQSYLNRYIKRNFGCTPKQLIDRNQGKKWRD